MLLSQVTFDEFLWWDEIVPFLFFILPCLVVALICYLLHARAKTRSAYSFWMLAGIFIWSYAGLYWYFYLIQDLRLMGELNSPVNDILRLVHRHGLRPMLGLLVLWLAGLPIVLLMTLYKKSCSARSEKDSSVPYN